MITKKKNNDVFEKARIGLWPLLFGNFGMVFQIKQSAFLSSGGFKHSQLSFILNETPSKRVYGLKWARAKSPVGQPVGLSFSVQGFSGGETAKIQVIETDANGTKQVIDTVQTTLRSGAGIQSVAWNTKASASQNATEHQGQLKVNEYTFACTVAGISANEVPSPLCLTTDLKVKLETQGKKANTTGKVSVKAGDGKAYVGQVQNGEAIVRNVPVGSTEHPKVSAKQTGYLLSVSPAPLPGGTTPEIIPIAEMPKAIHGGGWQPENQENYQGAKQDKHSALKKFWAFGRAASIVAGIMMVDDTHEPMTRWKEGLIEYRHDLMMGMLFVYQGTTLLGEFKVHNNKYGEVSGLDAQRIVATIDEYGNVTPITNQMSTPEGQEELAYRTYLANGGEASFAEWRASGKPDVSDKAELSPSVVNWSESKALGFEVGDPRDYPIGKQMFESLQKSGMSRDRALRVARDMLESGTELPSVVTVNKGSQLFKLVPVGATPSSSTPYFVSADVLERLPDDTHDIGNILGLPQIPNSYQVFSITAKENVDVYQSTIAKFSINNGKYIRDGGEIQTLVTRRDLFTDAQPLNRFIKGK